MNDNALGAGPAAGEAASSAEAKGAAAEEISAINGKLNEGKDLVVAGVPDEILTPVEAAEAKVGRNETKTIDEVPIGQISYGHDSEPLDDSPSLDYSGSVDERGESDEKAAGKLFYLPSVLGGGHLDYFDVLFQPCLYFFLKKYIVRETIKL